MSDTPPSEPRGTDPPPPPCDKSSRALVELACAMAIQDAVAYLRNTEIVAVAVMGAAQDMMMNNRNVAEATATLAAAQASVAAAGVFLGEIGAVVAAILKDYPRE